MDSATVERIAQRSGVAKTTIYRRWPHAAAIVMDAFLTEIGPFIPYSEKKTVIETFTHAVRQLERALAGARGQMLRHLLGAAQRDADLQQAFLSNWIEPRREQARLVIEGARERGEIRREVDADVLIDMIFGPVYYRLTIPYAALDDAYVATLVKQIFRGISVPGAN